MSSIFFYVFFFFIIIIFFFFLPVAGFILTFTTLSGLVQPTTIYFSQKTGFDISCKLSSLETICMECQNLFLGKNKKNISICPLLKFCTKL